MDDIVSGARVFTGERSAHGYRLNRMANALGSADERTRFRADEAAYLRAAGLSEHEAGLVTRRDWKGMMDHGASIYLLLKIGAAVGASLPEIGAHTAGGTLPDHKTRGGQ